MNSTALALKQDHALSTHVAEWSEDQKRLIRTTFANDATKDEFDALMAVASLRNLDPFKKQIYFVKRWDGNKKRETWATQVSIDGLRSIAERTGKYDGQDEPEYTYDEKGKLFLCKVRIYRRDWARPCVGVAHWSEFVQRTKDGSVTKMWGTLSHVMLAKCAEALAFRKAFPEDMGGLYTREEMGQAENDRVEVDAREVFPGSPPPISNQPSATSWEDVPPARPTPPPASAPRPTTPATVATRTPMDAHLDGIKERIAAAQGQIDLDVCLADLKVTGLPKDHPRRVEMFEALKAAETRIATQREPGSDG